MKSSGFIPNVYAKPTNIVSTEFGYLLNFSEEHHLNPQAKRIKIISEHSTEYHEVLSIPSQYQVLIHSMDLPGVNIFVYGEEIPDFLSVDYEALTALNISATQ